MQNQENSFQKASRDRRRHLGKSINDQERGTGRRSAGIGSQQTTVGGKYIFHNERHPNYLDKGRLRGDCAKI